MEPLNDGERMIWASAYGAAAITDMTVQACEDMAECVITVLRARVKGDKGGAMLRDMLGVGVPPKPGCRTFELRDIVIGGEIRNKSLIPCSKCDRMHCDTCMVAPSGFREVKRG